MKEYMTFSAPGRTEIGGNHTDHQHGCVLAAAVDLYTTAQVTPNEDRIIRVVSDGYPDVEIFVAGIEGLHGKGSCMVLNIQ